MRTDYVVNGYGVEIFFPSAVQHMDDDIREDLHFSLAPCSDQVFFDAYCAKHFEVFGEEWFLAGPNPVW